MSGGVGQRRVLPSETGSALLSFSLCGSGKWLSFFLIFIYFVLFLALLHLRFPFMWAFSSCSGGGHSCCGRAGFSLQWLLSCCEGSEWSPGSVVVARGVGLAAPRHVGSSQTRKKRTHPLRWQADS